MARVSDGKRGRKESQTVAANLGGRIRDLRHLPVVGTRLACVGVGTFQCGRRSSRGYEYAAPIHSFQC